MLPLSVKKWPKSLATPPPLHLPDPLFLPYQIFTFTKSLHYFYLKLEIKEQKQKMAIKIFQQQNKSIFPGNLYKTFCLWCTFLQDLVIHDHEGLLQAEKFYHPTKILEIPTVIASFCWSLPIRKNSDVLFWISLNTSDHFHLRWSEVFLLLVPYHMQKTNFITQLILEIKLTHYLLSFWACLGMPEHTHLK